MKSYCQKCGHGTDYLYDKPKFCANCGNSFSALTAPAPKVSKPSPRITQEIEDSENEAVDLGRMRNLSALQVEIAHDSGHSRSKIGDLVGTKNSDSEIPPRVVSTIDKKEAMENFKREAGFYPSKQSMNEEE
jgi:hypothetical protein